MKNHNEKSQAQTTNSRPSPLTDIQPIRVHQSAVCPLRMKTETNKKIRTHPTVTNSYSLNGHTADYPIPIGWMSVEDEG